MNRQKETLKFKGEEIFESSLLENNWFLFERYKRDQEDVLHLAYRSTEVFSQALLQLENDLRLYLSKYCVKNQGGQFLKETKEFVSGLYKKLPEEPEEILERIADLILGKNVLGTKGGAHIKRAADFFEVPTERIILKSMFVGDTSADLKLSNGIKYKFLLQSDLKESILENSGYYTIKSFQSLETLFES